MRGRRNEKKGGQNNVQNNIKYLNGGVGSVDYCWNCVCEFGSRPTDTGDCEMTTFAINPVGQRIVDIFDGKRADTKRRFTMFDVAPTKLKNGKRIKVKHIRPSIDHYCEHGTNVGRDSKGDYRHCERCQFEADNLEDN